MIKLEKANLYNLNPVNFLLSLLIVFHHGFTRNVGFIDSYNPLDYGVITAIERYFYNFSECAVPIFFFLHSCFTEHLMAVRRNIYQK